MDWTGAIGGFRQYLLLERSLSANTIEAYLHDVEKLQSFALQQNMGMAPDAVKQKDIEAFLAWLRPFGFEESSQARILSGIKAFFRYLVLEHALADNPAAQLEGPKLHRSIPDVLRIDEIEQIFAAVDLSQNHGHRDRAILETLYACGLRVSELISLCCSQVFAEDGYVRIIGKGNKERLVPIGGQALRQIETYRQHERDLPARGHEDILFLNRFGKKLSRVSIFKLVKHYAAKAGLDKEISPHTFRHSFATHLVEGGANLRAVQEMLGHESITTTEIYTHLDIHFLRDTVLQFHPINRKA
ncbi:MAG: site-specific tyrosine recombinase XerD [Saprospiraceae bacterium]|nr:site-specific tyrosine recombinase XerD [Saprospiraceae bacterium]